MGLTRFVSTINRRLHGLLSDDPAASPEATFQKTYECLREQTALLAWHRKQIGTLRDRQRELDRRAAELQALVQVHARVGDAANAWNVALELDTARQARADEARQMAEHEAGYAQTLIQVDGLKRRLAELQAHEG